MMTDLEARRVLRSAAPALSPAALTAVQAIGRFEGRYGAAFATDEGFAHNWGCIQTGKLPSHAPLPAKLPSRARCAPDGVEAGDVHEDGTAYTTCFRVYPSREAGAEALARRLGAYGDRFPGIFAVLGSGDADAIAHAMRATHYFELDAAGYAARIASNAKDLARALGEPVLVRRSWLTLGPSSRGAVRSLVLDLQRRLHVRGYSCEPSDGVYDLATRRSVEALQSNAEARLRSAGATNAMLASLPLPLHVDGIAGPKTARVLTALDELDVARGASW